MTVKTSAFIPACWLALATGSADAGLRSPREIPMPATTESAQMANPFARAEPVGGMGGPVMLAHAILVKAQPDRDAVVSDVPEEVLLTFNEGVGQEFLALAVVDEAGKRVDKRDVHQDFTDHSHLRASVEKLVPGRYMVRYRVLSADGHVVSGKYYFQIQSK